MVSLLFPCLLHYYFPYLFPIYFVPIIPGTKTWQWKTSPSLDDFPIQIRFSWDFPAIGL